MAQIIDGNLHAGPRCIPVEDITDISSASVSTGAIWIAAGLSLVLCLAFGALTTPFALDYADYYQDKNFLFDDKYDGQYHLIVLVASLGMTGVVGLWVAFVVLLAGKMVLRGQIKAVFSLRNGSVVYEQMSQYEFDGLVAMWGQEKKERPKFRGLWTK